MSSSKKTRWEDWEKDYLIKNAPYSTDAELAAHLGRSKTSIIEMRRKLGVKKNKKTIKPEDVRAVLAEKTRIEERTPVEEMDDAQRRRAYLNNLTSSPSWHECLVMFDDEELELYKQKWVEFMMTYDTINEVEKGSLHIMLCAEIRINRYQKMEKEFRDMAKGGDAEAGSKAISLHKEMKDMVEIYLKAQDELNASRKQRVKEEGDQRINMLTLLKELEEKEQREKLGKEADTYSYIKKLELQRLRRGHYIRSEDSDTEDG